MDAERLELSREEMRQLGYRVIDLLVDHYDGLREKPVPQIADRATVEAKIREPLPQQGQPAEVVLQKLMDDVFAHTSHVNHPRFYAFIPSPSNFVSVMGDALASGFNVFAGTWIESSGPSMVELTTLEWLRDLCGLPPSAGGLFVSGGSAANLTALAVARHAQLGDQMNGAVIYYSDQTHSSIERGLRVLGFQPEQIRVLPSDAAYRLDVAALRRAVAEDRAAGRMPFCVIANAGTTNTGTIDPFEALGPFCRENRLWLHADGAYGVAAVFCERGKQQLAGLQHVDSLSLDPHKWLFQPYEIGCVLVRDRALMRQAFHTMPDYLKDTERVAEEVNFSEYGIQLTRSFRALKLWLSLKVFGAEAFGKAVAHGFAMAEYAEAKVRQMPGFEVSSPAQMGIVAFRSVPPYLAPDQHNAHNSALAQRIIDDGQAMFSTSVLRGQTVIRCCPINPRTTPADLDHSFARLEALAG